MRITVGADPEVFVQKDGLIVSAGGLVKGTKTEPFKVDKGAVQVDGCALEFNIDPADNVDEFKHNINTVLNTLKTMIPVEYKLTDYATAYFNQGYFDQLPEQDRMLGCDPDFNAYTRQINKPHLNPNVPWRAAGGHVHIGWTQDENPYDPSHFAACCQLVRQLDYFLGLPSVLLDGDLERRRNYGQPGNFRPKSYGLEYRVLSNFWIMKEEFIEYVFEQTKKAFDELVEKDNDLYANYGDAAKVVMIENNKYGARDIIQMVHIDLPNGTK